jgi:nitrogen-specific signal transduction histidine kinase
VNNPLEAIKNALYLMQVNGDGDKNSRFLEIARKETERVSHIIRQMLGFARRPGEVDWVDINQVLEETLVLMEKKMHQLRIRITKAFDESLPPIRARADQLRQVFLNLIINAQQAIKGEGEIVISTCNRRSWFNSVIAASGLQKTIWLVSSIHSFRRARKEPAWAYG